MQQYRVLLSLVSIRVFIAAVFLPLVLLTIQGASALSMDFSPSNLAVSGSNAYSTVGMTVNGIHVDVTAFTIENSATGAIINKTQINSAGAGVYVSGSNNLGVSSNASTNVDSHDLDGGSSDPDFDEGLLFSFNRIVTLNYINFDNFTNGDDFNLTVDGVNRLIDFSSINSSSLASAVAGQEDEFNFSGISGRDFLFWADGNTDSFRIDRMDVVAVDAAVGGAMDNIPEPGSIMLLSIGLISFAFFRKKQKIEVNFS